MRFWDSSALVPLVVSEDASADLETLFGDGDRAAVWWAAEVEIASALARLEREAALTPEEANDGFGLLREVIGVCDVIDPVETIREAAKRFLRVHDLRAADALQLAAAFVASEGRPPSLQLVCLDERLVSAARREGFEVIDRDGQPPPTPEPTGGAEPESAD